MRVQVSSPQFNSNSPGARTWKSWFLSAEEGRFLIQILYCGKGGQVRQASPDGSPLITRRSLSSPSRATPTGTKSGREVEDTVAFCRSGMHRLYRRHFSPWIPRQLQRSARNRPLSTLARRIQSQDLGESEPRFQQLENKRILFRSVCQRCRRSAELGIPDCLR